MSCCRKNNCYPFHSFHSVNVSSRVVKGQYFCLVKYVKGRKFYIPHGSSLQGTVSVRFSRSQSPLSTTIFLVLFCTPPSHNAEQFPKSDHSDTSQVTVKLKAHDIILEWSKNWRICNSKYLIGHIMETSHDKTLDRFRNEDQTNTS